MSLTRPITHPPAYVVTSSDWNEFAANWQEMFDKVAGLNFTPTWSSSGTQPVLSNGTLTGKYVRIGPAIWFVMSLTAGSSTTFGTGRWEFLLPFTAGFTLGAFTAIMQDISVPTVVVGAGFMISTTEFSVTYTGDPAPGITVTTPFTWAVNDTLQVAGFYLASTY
jgi:hypothetical protein